VVVIGSGATAVTLVPALAETAASVTMLQRTPSYIASRPSVDRIADALRARLPAGRRTASSAARTSCCRASPTGSASAGRRR
jgi:cation diffusion facilitator CzcD-associated flavoprotein CzcO